LAPLRALRSSEHKLDMMASLAGLRGLKARKARPHANYVHCVLTIAVPRAKAESNLLCFVHHLALET